MHLKITRIRQKDKVLEYASIVYSYRDGRRKVLKNLGRIHSPEDMWRFKEILESMRREDTGAQTNKDDRVDDRQREDVSRQRNERT